MDLERKTPAWDDDLAWEAALQAKEKPRPLVDELGDLVVALSVRRHMTGYALLRFADLLPLQPLGLGGRAWR